MIEPCVLGRTVPLKKDANGNPIFIALPKRVELMETYAGDFFEVLSSLTVAELRAVQPTGKYVPLFDSLIAIRQVMGGEGSVG